MQLYGVFSLGLYGCLMHALLNSMFMVLDNYLICHHVVLLVYEFSLQAFQFEETLIPRNYERCFIFNLVLLYLTSICSSYKN